MPLPEISPRATVLLPVRNGERYLREAVDSVLSQTFPGFELLVVDDGSDDGTPGVLAAVSDPRLRVVRNEAGLGVARALNRGLSLARGEIVARMDADDVCRPERLERQIRFLDAHPEVGILGSAYDRIGPEGSFVETVRHPETHEEIEWALFFGNPLAHPSVAMRREVALEAGGYPEGEPGTPLPEDYALWCRLCERTRMANLPEPLVAIRKHGGNVMELEAGPMARAASEINRGRIAERVGEPVSREAAGSLLTRRCGTGEAFAECLALFRRLCRSGARDAALPPGASRRLRARSAEVYWELIRCNLPLARPGTLLREFPGGAGFAADVAREAARRALARF